MGPYKNIVYKMNQNGLNRKRQIIDQMLDNLHVMQMDMIEQAVILKQQQGFPEANAVLLHISRKDQ